MQNHEFLHNNIILRSDKQTSAQGSVFYVKQNTHQDGMEYVLKIYKNDDKKSYLLEKKVLEDVGALPDPRGFPKLISCIEGPDSSEILLQALGPNLRNLQKQCPHRKFSKPTVFKIVIQIIERLRALHSLGYVHNDLKLENILVGHKDPEIVYLIDFGLTQTFLLENGTHSEKEYVRKFSGNFLFASLNSCRGNNKSRRDDIESAMYIMIYLLNDNYLPWCDIEKKYEQGMEFKDVLRERLEIEYTKRLFSMIPKELIQTLKNVLTLKFDQVPDYDEIINAINRTKNNYVGHSPSVAYQFEWTKNLASQIQKQIHQENSKFDASECSLDRNLLNFRSKFIGSRDGPNVSPTRNNNGMVYSSKMFVQLLDSQELGTKSPMNISGRLRNQGSGKAGFGGSTPQNMFSDENDKFQKNQKSVKSIGREEMKMNLDNPELREGRFGEQVSPLGRVGDYRNRSASIQKKSQFSKGSKPNSQFAKKQQQQRRNDFSDKMHDDDSDDDDEDSLSECRDEDFEQEEIDEIITKKAFNVDPYSLECQQMNIKLLGRKKRTSQEQDYPNQYVNVDNLKRPNNMNNGKRYHVDQY